MNQDPLENLRIASNRKRRSSSTMWLIIFGVLVATGVAAYLALPRPNDGERAGAKSGRETTVVKADQELAARAKKLAAERGQPNVANSSPSPSPALNTRPNSSRPDPADAAAPHDTTGPLLTVSGYIIAHERIELSPRFLGVVRWIGVKKGDSVTNGQVVVRLDDTEYQARLGENDAQAVVAKVAVDHALADLKRAEVLVTSRVEMQKMLDDARLAKANAEAQLKQVSANRILLETYLDWCTIRSPVNGVVLDKLVDPNELVTPQTFGSGRGPSTSLIAVADLTDLQVEVDVNEADLSKVRLGQRCTVSPEAYPEKKYVGEVAEIAPEANRAKGTLQVKVQIRSPDRFLTPELSAKVQFFAP